MVVPICLQWKQCLAGSLGVLLLMGPVRIRHTSHSGGTLFNFLQNVL